MFDINSHSACYSTAYDMIEIHGKQQAFKIAWNKKCDSLDADSRKFWTNVVHIIAEFVCKTNVDF